MSMNDSTHFDEDRSFDRLVDGELSPDEYQSLLRSLDRQPDGWKDCALAFLEAQAWEKELGDLRDEATATSEEKLQQAPPRPWWMHSGPLVLAMAASFLIAFGLGVWSRQSLWPSHHAGTSNQLAGDARPADEFPGSVADDAPSVAPADESQLAENQGSNARQGASPESSQPLGNITLVMEGEDGTPRRLEVPVFANSPFRQRLLSGDGSTVDQKVWQAIEEAGHRLHRERTLVPLQLENGQSVVVPVEDVQVVPVGLPPL